jgi:hypothetical protein
VLLVVGFRRKSVATDAEIEAAVKAMRAIRTRGGRVHDDVLRAYARAALDAAVLVQVAEYRRRAEQSERFVVSDRDQSSLPTNIANAMMPQTKPSIK